MRDLRPTIESRPAGWLSLDLVKEVAESEDSVSAAQRAFYNAALPALPALLLGFVSLEGRHLVCVPTAHWPAAWHDAWRTSCSVLS
jgi:hypothetical protein